MQDQDRVPGAILAGGLARRMGGGDKPLRLLAGRPLLSHVIERLQPQCAPILLNANGDPARFSDFALTVVGDSVPDNPGPLAGILAALEWAGAQSRGTGYVLITPGDCPFLPPDLALCLRQAADDCDASIVLAASGGQRHPVVGLWRVDLAGALRDALLEEGLRKVGQFVDRYPNASVSWTKTPIDPFFNANSEAELQEAERLIKHREVEL
ncbi:molybdenum cofactor guanylyltransferase [Fulvimarina manganoxydans]|uniref:Molybdenum cofactor guanylyltransferase n=1 Tax=Fulvimarina manganoxydans TaxID=937218 RepID=A0A1W1ZSA3_9HYPH|nr:molybdenum cofactor guanylyltransferase MobA [Fulvimarina manganoxydans]SMC51254.1 molybdenum cofactor guanylyltransferase [Fulvimarina manganoxydans]